jgi:hypothetical protein
MATNGKRPHKKTTAKSTALVKRAQPHGGALNSGGTPGNRGSTGRPPSAIRAAARAGFDAMLPTLTKIARATKSKDADRIRAIDVLGKYGMDQAVSVADVRECLRQTTEEIREYLPPDQAETLLGRIRPIWMSL